MAAVSTCASRACARRICFLDALLAFTFAIPHVDPSKGDRASTWLPRTCPSRMPQKFSTLSLVTRRQRAPRYRAGARRERASGAVLGAQ